MFFKDCIDNIVSYLKCFELLWLGRWADAWWVRLAANQIPNFKLSSEQHQSLTRRAFKVCKTQTSIQFHFKGKH